MFEIKYFELGTRITLSDVSMCIIITVWNAVDIEQKYLSEVQSPSFRVVLFRTIAVILILIVI